jgi:hypothetical protein
MTSGRHRRPAPPHQLPAPFWDLKALSNHTIEALLMLAYLSYQLPAPFWDLKALSNHTIEALLMLAYLSYQQRLAVSLAVARCGRSAPTKLGNHHLHLRRLACQRWPVSNIVGLGRGTALSVTQNQTPTATLQHKKYKVWGRAGTNGGGELSLRWVQRRLEPRDRRQ